MNFIDTFLNSITMYRLVLYGLIVLSAIAIILGFTSILPFSGLSMLFTMVLVLIACFVTNFAFARVLKATTNSESYLITALILFLILAPVLNTTDALVTIAAGVIAMASKYIIAIEKKHIFNPAALAVFLLGLFGFGNGIWWVGSLVLLPFTLVLGLLIVRKIRRFQLLGAFLFTAAITVTVFNLRNGLTIPDSLQQLIASWPLVFFGTVMLTEPLTTPPQKKRYIPYGGLVGVLFGLQFSIGPLFASPEFALVAGNIFSFLISPRKKLFLRLQEKRLLVPNIHEFVFTGNLPFAYVPGQYLEWTLPMKHIDNRGNRRYFTIASSPTEKEVKLGVKIIPGAMSAFKKTLAALDLNSQIVAGQLSGDFVLPEDKSKKLVLVAGGIGVTPFRSMLKYLVDKQEKRDIIFFYACSTHEEFVYQDIFSLAEKELGVKVVNLITKAETAPKGWKGETGRLNDALIKKYVSDIDQRVFYLSGPNAMVEGYKSLLHKMGVNRKNIVTDYFPGF